MTQGKLDFSPAATARRSTPACSCECHIDQRPDDLFDGCDECIEHHLAPLLPRARRASRACEVIVTGFTAAGESRALSMVLLDPALAVSIGREWLARDWPALTFVRVLVDVAL